mmetsp:Transcript_18447/g.51753  ORF Transcript_18447/g.51753 Transcript_18447/m.51753 type:complete len:341 (+) Transcript_18447:62-1084(+)
MALRQSAQLLARLGRVGSSSAGSSGSACASSFGSHFGFFSSSRDEERISTTGLDSNAEIRRFVTNEMRQQHQLPSSLTGFGGATRNPLLSGALESSVSSPFSAGQSAAMSTVRQVQSGSVVNSLMVGVYKFWRSQAPYDKAPAAVDSRLLPSVMAASDERANVGMWATTFFCTILSCNLLGLIPFNEAPTSGLGFATGLGISTWATATALGFYKLGFTFPGHFIPGGTPWPMAFIFVPLETISYSFRAVSLGVRLWVNMLAGHTLLHILTGMSLAMPFSLPFYTALPSTFAVCCLLSALVGLEYLVAVLQSGVFSILSTVYVGEFNGAKLAAPLAKMVKH